MKKLILTLLLGAGAWSAADARAWYVSSGLNNDGTRNTLKQGTDDRVGTRGDIDNPFRTIQYASDLTTAGDIVYIRKGLYKGFTFTVLLNITDPARSGTAGKEIVYRNYQPDGVAPLLKFSSDNGIKIAGGISYIGIYGLRIQGNNSAFDTNPSDGIQVDMMEVTRAQDQDGGCRDKSFQVPTPINGPFPAADEVKTGTDPTTNNAYVIGTPPNKYNGNGISVTNSGSSNPHHIRIINNEVFECGGAGISIGSADYVNVEQNTVHDNCWYTIYSTSGISLLGSKDFDKDRTAYRIVINRNTLYNNRTYVNYFVKKIVNGVASNKSGTCNGITDGNGIIIDRNNADNSNYTGRFLVSNNLCYNNGGAGIQVFQSNDVAITNNTCYQNSRSPELMRSRGEIYTGDAVGVNVRNNILVTDNMSRVNGYSGTTAPTYENNLFFGGLASGGTQVAGTKTVTGDPLFVDIPKSNFHLSNTAADQSPAINKGQTLSPNFIDATKDPNTTTPTPLDKDGKNRVYGSAPDIGCYEVQNPPGMGRAALATTTNDPASTGSVLEAFPNPFSGTATLAYTIDQAGPVRLEVLDLLGRRVALLVDEAQTAGRHQAAFAAPALGAALFQVRLTTAQGTTAQKLASQP